MRNIVLTGFMGTGKTAVSEELVRITGFARVEVDSEIEDAEGMSIPEIFSTKGEPYFREAEAEAIKRVSAMENAVISTGGGAVMREENMRVLREKGVIVCLKAEPETILKRTSVNQDRPLLQVDDPLSKIRELMRFRAPFYEKADVSVDTEGKTPLDVAKEILEAVGWKD